MGDYQPPQEAGASPLHAVLAQFIPPSLHPVLLGPHAIAFFLASVASMGTLLGGLLVILLAHFTGADPSSPSTSRLMGILQAFSAGVMMYITCFDLIPESVDQLETRETMLWFFGGVLAFGVLEGFVLPDDHGHDHDNAHIEGSSGGTGASPKKGGKKSKATAQANGVAPTVRERELMRASTITFLALTLHNLPEGLGVYLSSLSDVRLGLQFAAAICLHNIPEGMAVAIPLYAATKGDTSRVLWWTLLNGLAEPLGVVAGGALLHSYLSPAVLCRCLAAVGGIMACISIHELQPTAIQFAGKARATISFFGGMLVCFLALEAVTEWFGGHGHSHGIEDQVKAGV
ncbi:hypothetical protein HK104_006393 [Borealophlyctis nickersoniae]|nr:hypothetical protein HK104_006393 [Borealophlyctis nickersoniae]